MQHHPFAYAVIDDVLPDEIFRRAYDSIPSFEFLSSKIKLEEGQYNGKLAAPFANLKDHADPDVWNAIEMAMMSEEFEALLIEKFHSLMHAETRQRLSRPILRGLKLNCDPAGSYLKPHTDSPEILLSFFIYQRSGAPDPSLDTVLYAPVDAEARLKRITETEYSHEEFVDHVRAGQIEFKPNRAFCFLRTQNSVHGIEPIAESAAPRYAISFRLKWHRPLVCAP